MNTSSPTIAFLGAGNMARALIGGLVASGVSAQSLRAADPGGGQRQGIADDFGIETFADNNQAIESADAVVLAVKPQVMDEVLAALKLPGPDCLVISIAAGVPLARLESPLPDNQPVVRAMPNTPALYRRGITGAVANAAAENPERRALADRVLGSVGPVEWIADEALMDAVTAVSGSGPAYYFLLAEALAAAGVRSGLPEETARRLATHTAAGAGHMLAESGQPPEKLREQVTSPGGTTAAALEAFETGGLRELVDRAVEAAFDRGRELGKGQ